MKVDACWEATSVRFSTALCSTNWYYPDGMVLQSTSWNRTGLTLDTPLLAAWSVKSSETDGNSLQSSKGLMANCEAIPSAPRYPAESNANQKRENFMVVLRGLRDSDKIIPSTLDCLEV
jgi:hypothetical protein